MAKFWKNNKGWIITVCVIALLVVGTVLSEGTSVPDEGEEYVFDKSLLSEEVAAWYDDTQSKKYVVTVLAGSSCGYCANFKPVMEEVAKEKKLSLHWFYIDTVGQDDANALEKVYNLPDTGSVPYMFVTNEGKLVNHSVGYMEKDALLTFLKDNKVIK